MLRSIWLVSLLALLQGCATQLGIPAGSSSDNPGIESAGQVLQFQRSSVEADGAALKPADLRPGDILLTAAETLPSAGIQMMTFAPVSHAAVYIGDGQVVEAVRPRVQVRRVEDLLVEEATALVFRHPDLTAEQAQSIRAFVLEQVGKDFNYFSMYLHVPTVLVRRLCELPLIPSVVRDACIKGIGAIHYLAADERQYFCSQLVLQAYRQAGVSITDADPRMLTPADILHMREGDVSSVRIHKRLLAVGHLKYQPPVAVALQQ